VPFIPVLTQGRSSYLEVSDPTSFSSHPTVNTIRAVMVRKRPLGDSDRVRTGPEDMTTRVVGVAVILITAALAYSLIFTAFPQRVTYQWEFENGERVPITHITCPSPWSVLYEDATPGGVVSGDLCVLPARGQVVQGVTTAVVGLVVGVWLLTRPTRRPGPLPELPDSVRALLSKR